MDKINVLELISKLDIEGVEYTYGRVFKEREIKDSDLAFFNSLKHVSLHSPFSLSLKKIPQDEVNAGLNIILTDCKRVRAKQVVFHPGQVLPAEFFSRKEFVFLTENMHKKPQRDKNAFEAILNSHPDTELCLDVNHAYTWSKVECGEIVSKWRNRIAQVHFSNCYKRKRHLSFKKVSKEFLKSIEPIMDLNVPIIIEEEMQTSNLSEIKEEIKRIKDILGFS
jgi:endonuclease IV